MRQIPTPLYHNAGHALRSHVRRTGRGARCWPAQAVSALRLPSAEDADSANTCAFYGMPGSRMSESENQIEA